jgi:hypothetical protein
MAWLETVTYDGVLMKQLISQGETDFKWERGGILTYKISTDIWFYLAALQHPMRTRDPEKAKLFVVPTLLNQYVRWGFDPDLFCREKHVCGGRLIKETMTNLTNSKWFQKSQGNDHIMVISHNNYWSRMPWMLRVNNAFSKCHLLGYEGRKDNNPDRANFRDFKFGSRCPLEINKTHDLAMIASLHPERPNFLDRRNVCNYMGKTNYDMAVCGSGKQCPTLAQARFSFQVRGDTYGSQRLVDILLSGTIPIFTRKQQYDAQAEFIDWNHISYFADISQEQSFLQDIHRIMADKVGYIQKQQNVMANRDLFDWETTIPFDMFMYKLESKLWPESTKNRTSWHSALMMP